MDKATLDTVAGALESRRNALALALRAGDRLPIEALRGSARVLSRSPSGVLSLAVSADVQEKDCGVVVDERRMSASFPVSTPRKDRMGDVVVPRGCLPHIKNYERNPRVFFGHKSDDFSIGSARDPDSGALALDVGDDVIRSTCFFHGETAESECVFRLVKRRELQATSIGFLPVVASIIKDDEEDEEEGRPKKTREGERIVKFGGFLPLRFLEWDLTEWSVVGVPANPDACESLSATLSRGHVEGERLPLSLRKALEPFKLKARVWSQGFNPETNKYSGTLALGESELEYADGRLVRIDEVKLLKDPSPEEPLPIETPTPAAVTAGPASIETTGPANTFVLTAESLAAVVEKAVAASLAKVKLSALDDASGGVAVPSEGKPEEEDVSARVAELGEALKAHVEADGREHKEILAAVNELRSACETERRVARQVKQEHEQALQHDFAKALGAIAAGNEAALLRLEKLTGRRN